jgi:hypothetical protein
MQRRIDERSPADRGHTSANRSCRRRYGSCRARNRMPSARPDHRRPAFIPSTAFRAPHAGRIRRSPEPPSHRLWSQQSGQEQEKSSLTNQSRPQRAVHLGLTPVAAGPTRQPAVPDARTASICSQCERNCQYFFAPAYLPRRSVLSMCSSAF